MKRAMSVDELGPYLLHQMDQIWPVESLEGVTSILAVSGGPDSIALARLVSECKMNSRVFIAHFDHGLRKQSAKDAAFVKEFSRENGFEFIGGQARGLAAGSNQGQGLEAKARAARYEFLKEAAQSTGARFIATAHTMDDQAETLIHRFFRGTGIRGLQGIANCRMLQPGTSLIRPLLHCRKRDLLAYLALKDQKFQIDESNGSGEFTRNRIRNELIPLVSDILDQDPVPGLSSLAELAAGAQSWIDRALEDMYDQHVKIEKRLVSIHTKQGLPTQPRFLLNELLALVWRRQNWPQQQMSSAKWNSLSDLIVRPAAEATNGDGPSTKIMLPGKITAESRREGIAIWDDSDKSD